MISSWEERQILLQFAGQLTTPLHEISRKLDTLIRVTEEIRDIGNQQLDAQRLQLLEQKTANDKLDQLIKLLSPPPPPMPVGFRVRLTHNPRAPVAFRVRLTHNKEK